MDCTNDSQSDQEDSSLEIDGYESTDNADQNLNVLKDGIIHLYRGKYGGVQLALNGHLYTRDKTSKLTQIQHESGLQNNSARLGNIETKVSEEDASKRRADPIDSVRIH